MSGPEVFALSRRDVLCAGIAVAATLTDAVAANAETVERDDLADVFRREGVLGTFATYDPATDRLTLVNAERAKTAYVPASTFKIPNSLIALETGAVSGPNEIFPYDGRPRWVKAWERDMTLREAVVASNVPVFQEVARRIGLSQYRKWLVRLDYGNHMPGGVVDTFWLEGPLAISAIQQVRFLSKLALGVLPASKGSQAIVRDIIRSEEKDGRTIFAKTGWAKGIGWWVGWVEHGNRVRPFALNIDMARLEDGPKRIAISKELLARLDYY